MTNDPLVKRLGVEEQEEWWGNIIGHGLSYCFPNPPSPYTFQDDDTLKSKEVKEGSLLKLGICYRPQEAWLTQQERWLSQHSSSAMRVRIYLPATDSTTHVRLPSDVPIGRLLLVLAERLGLHPAEVGVTHYKLSYKGPNPPGPYEFRYDEDTLAERNVEEDSILQFSSTFYAGCTTRTDTPFTTKQATPMPNEDQTLITVGPSTATYPRSMSLPLFAAVPGLTTRVWTHKPVWCGGLLVFVWAETLEGLLEHGRSDPVNEVGGWLLGRYGSDGDHVFVVIEMSLPAEGSHKSPVSFRFTNEDQQRLANIKQKRYPNLSVVGWYHSHPPGLQLSETDKEAHRNVFREPFQIAMVMSMGGRDIGCAVWDNGEISEVGGFFVLEKIRRDSEGQAQEQVVGGGA